MTPRYPFGKLCKAELDESLFLLAASGPTINCISYSEGKLLHQWPSRHNDTDDETDHGSEDGDRPNKRRKVDSDDHATTSRQASEASDISVEIVSERKKGERKKTKILETKLPNVSHLLMTADSKNVIAVTAEDKALRVFELSTAGRLKQISQRVLPKKPCAIRLAEDDKTILTADKFGDVYAVPLHQSLNWVPTMKVNIRSSEHHKPAATELTVHTKGNLEALRQQQQQGGRGRHPSKDGPDFEHQIILGHVSLLTDLTVAEGVVNDRKRPFIITADRDEHIRVSRGMPQAHVIENFCLGHQEFVTKLCILPRLPQILVAGNGEPTLRLYDWQNGVLKQKVDVYHPSPIRVQHKMQDDAVSLIKLPHGRSVDKLAVSGIWPVEFETVTGKSSEEVAMILVALEGLPFLYTFLVEPDSDTHYAGVVELHGNVLDVVVLNATKRILVSIDNVHQPFSMKSYQDEAEPIKSPLQVFKIQPEERHDITNTHIKWREVSLPFDASRIVASLPHAPQPCDEDVTSTKTHERTFSPLGELLYGLENFRKKRNATAEEEAAIEAEEADQAESMEISVES